MARDRFDSMPILTNWDRALLRKHLNFYEALDHGRRTPTTPRQLHFLAVCRDSAAPITQHEVAYLRYRST